MEQFKWKETRGWAEEKLTSLSRLGSCGPVLAVVIGHNLINAFYTKSHVAFDPSIKSFPKVGLPYEEM